MKKFATALLACFAMVQSTYAATSALTESLLEYEAIISAIGSNPSFENVIPVTEFIVDIERITRQINILGEVKYEILTRLVGDDPGSRCEAKGGHKGRSRPIRYVATLNVAANPGVGPNIVTVVSIVKSQKHHH